MKYILDSPETLTRAMVDAGVNGRHDLSVKAGLAYSTLTHLHSNDASYETAYRIARALGMSVEQLFVAKK